MKNAPFFQFADHPRTWSDYLDQGSFPVDTHLYAHEAGELLVDNLQV